MEGASLAPAVEPEARTRLRGRAGRRSPPRPKSRPHRHRPRRRSMRPRRPARQHPALPELVLRDPLPAGTRRLEFVCSHPL